MNSERAGTLFIWCQLNVVRVGMGAQSLGLPPIKCIMYADLGEMPFYQGESGALEVHVDKVVFQPGLEGDQVWNHHPCTALFSLPRHTLIFGILLCTPLSLTGRRCGVMFRASPRLHPTEDTYSVLTWAGISRRMHSKHKAPTAYSSQGLLCVHDHEYCMWIHKNLPFIQRPHFTKDLHN